MQSLLLGSALRYPDHHMADNRPAHFIKFDKTGFKKSLFSQIRIYQQVRTADVDLKKHDSFCLRLEYCHSCKFLTRTALYLEKPSP